MPLPTRLSRLADALMEACWLAGLVVTPLFFNVYSSRIFEPDKTALFRSLSLLLAAAWAIKLLDQRRSRASGSADSASRRLRTFLSLPLVGPAAGLALITGLGVALSLVPRVSFLGSYQRLQGAFTTLCYLLAFAAIYANLRRRSQAERLVNVVISTSFPIAVYGILQRLQLDPIPWGADTVERVTSTLGNAIFIGAYLIMACLLTLGRAVHALRQAGVPGPARARWAALAAVYIAVALAQVAAIYLSGSRGPWLGLLAGVFLASLLWASYLRRTGLMVGLLAGALASGAFLIVLNIPGGPLESLRQHPTIGRLGRVFEVESGTGRVRALIWEGNVRLISPHAPLEFPDGRLDALNSVRPLLGYGLESLYVAFNRFYDPELASLEARNASPDRSHNETWDILVSSGLLGLVVNLVLYAAIFYYGLRWMGFLADARSRWLYFALYAGGGLLGAAGLWLALGPGFAGVGLSTGILLGLMGFLAYSRLFLRTKAKGEEPGAVRPEDALLMASVVGALMAHVTEISFGIAIVSTRLHFWTLAGLMAVVGQGQLADDPSPKPESRPARSRRKKSGSVAPTRSWPVAAFQGGLMASLILLTLGFNFVNSNSLLDRAAAVLAQALTRLPTQGGRTSFGILGLMAASWLVLSLILWLSTPGARLRQWLTILGVSLGAALISWPAFASRAASIGRAPPSNADELIALTGRLAGILGLYYVFLLLLVVLLAVALVGEWPARFWNLAGQRVSGGARLARGALYAGLLGLSALVGVAVNLRGVQADIFFKAAASFEQAGNLVAAVPVFERTVALAPNEDYYYLFLGRAYLGSGIRSQTVDELDGWMEKSRVSLQEAQRLNPLNTDHAANLGRLYRNWAAATEDPGLRSERARLSEGYYTQAVSLSPNNSTLWNERAELNYQLLDDPEAALAHFEHSAEVDPWNEQTFLALGAFHESQAASETDPRLKPEQLDLAISAYRETAARYRDLALGREALLNLGRLLAAQGDYPAAIAEYEAAFELEPPEADLWNIHFLLAGVYQQAGQANLARQEAAQALALAPEDRRAEVQAFLDSLDS